MLEAGEFGGCEAPGWEVTASEVTADGTRVLWAQTPDGQVVRCGSLGGQGAVQGPSAGAAARCPRRGGPPVGGALGQAHLVVPARVVRREDLDRAVRAGRARAGADPPGTAVGGGAGRRGAEQRRVGGSPSGGGLGHGVVVRARRRCRCRGEPVAGRAGASAGTRRDGDAQSDPAASPPLRLPSSGRRDRPDRRRLRRTRRC